MFFSGKTRAPVYPGAHHQQQSPQAERELKTSRLHPKHAAAGDAHCSTLSTFSSLILYTLPLSVPETSEHSISPRSVSPYTNLFLSLPHVALPEIYESIAGRKIPNVQKTKDQIKNKNKKKQIYIHPNISQNLFSELIL